MTETFEELEAFTRAIRAASRQPEWMVVPIKGKELREFYGVEKDGIYKITIDKEPELLHE